MQTSHFGAAFEIKTIDESQRIISGYAAVIGTMDRGRDIIDAKALTATLTEKKPADVAVFIAHKADALPIGIPLVMRLDAKGLYTETKVKPGPVGDDLLETAKFLQEHGQPLGLSIGYYARKSAYEVGPDHKTARRLLDIDLMEYSFAPHQTIMHPDAVMTGVKTMNGHYGYRLDERDGRFFIVCLDGDQEVGSYDSEETASAVLGALSKVTGENPYFDSPFVGEKTLMPYNIRQVDGQYCVVNAKSGKKLGCHPSRKEAIQQMRAVYANEGKTVDLSESQIADLPDSAFLYIEDGDKDLEGKTLPRSLRHFPIVNADGEIEPAYVSMALAELPDSKIDGTVKMRLEARARRLLEREAKTEEPSWKEGSAPEIRALGYHMIDLSERIADDQEALRRLGLDTKAGRAMSDTHLTSLHDRIVEMKQLHDATCPLSEDCPLKTDQEKVLTRYQYELSLLEV
jgi:HK97 family phage prohead protease